MLHENKRISKMIEELLEISEIEKTTGSLQKLNISNLLSEFLDKARFDAVESSIIINCDLEPELEIIGNQRMVYLLFENLLSNAIHFSKKEIFITLKGRNDGILLTIKDDGPGISKKEIGLIWNRFYRGKEHLPKVEYEGAGLGLPLVKKVVEIHNGWVAAKNNKGKGATFTVFLPK
ncbi:MAG: HAMP domain-containing sensor histidine kinase [Tissierellia bacterium]|nr:HAMP domain-containing sensor histidine kinase [Tissierellia bacterium]